MEQTQLPARPLGLTFLWGNEHHARIAGCEEQQSERRPSRGYRRAYGRVNAPRVTVLLLEPPATVITNVVYRVGGLKQAFSNARKQLSRHILSEIAVTDVHRPQYSAYAKAPRR